MHADDVVRVLWFFLPAYLANMSPVLVQGSFHRFATPMDGGRSFRGKRILGDHKTWRGLVAGIVVGTVTYELQRLAYVAGLGASLALIDYARHPLLPGFLMGLGTGLGDALKSFFKRRIDIAPGASWPVFDQLDFFAGAYAFVSAVYLPPLVPTLRFPVAPSRACDSPAGRAREDRVPSWTCRDCVPSSALARASLHDSETD